MRKYICIITLSILLISLCIITLIFDSSQTKLGEDGSLPYLSASDRAKIEQTWSANYPNTNAPQIGHNMYYYGSYEGYDILFLHTSTHLSDNIKREIADYTFWFCRPFQLFAHKNGEFYTLDDAYAAGLVSLETIATANEIHRIYNKSMYEFLYSDQTSLGAD